MTQPVDVIVPVYNEADGLERFHRRISAVPLPIQLIFVDNASSDGSLEILRRIEGARLIEHDRNEGYGASLLDGIAHMTSDVGVIIDADCEYPPEAIPRLVEALDRAPVAYASRFAEGRGADMPALKRWGNRLITSSFNVLFGQSLTDLYTGCKAFRRSALDGLALERKGFEHVLELGVRLAQSGVAIIDVPVEFEPRTTGRSKMRHVSETAKFLALLARYRLEGGAR